MHLLKSTSSVSQISLWETEKRPDFVKALTSDNLQKQGNENRHPV